MNMNRFPNGVSFLLQISIADVISSGLCYTTKLKQMPIHMSYFIVAQESPNHVRSYIILFKRKYLFTACSKIIKLYIITLSVYSWDTATNE